ncbi:MAG: TlpA family protein disulfide reductase [Aristaeellaceae bacterium]
MKKIGIVMLVALWCLFSCTALAEGAYQPGDSVEDFTVTLSDGATFTLSEALAEKKAVLLNFWASWCYPCMREMPAMEEAWQQLQDDVAFVCLSTEPADTLETIASIREKLGLATLPMGIDGEALCEQFDNPDDGIPFTVVIDRNGVLCFRHCGSITDAALFVNLMNVYTDADYSESRILTEMPKLRPTAAASRAEEMRSAIGAQGMEIVLPEDEEVWPFVAREGGVYASNTQSANTQAAFSVKLTAEAGEGVAFSCMAEAAPMYTLFSVSVDGVLCDVLNGNMDWTDHVVVFETAGEHVVTFTFDYQFEASQQEISAALRSIRKVSAAEAEEILAARLQSVKTLEGQNVEIDVLEGAFRDAVIYYGEEPYENTQVLDSEFPVRLRIRIGQEIDARYVVVDTCEDVFILDSLPHDELGYLVELTDAHPDAYWACYTFVYDDAAKPIAELTTLESFEYFTRQAIDLQVIELNDFAQQYPDWMAARGQHSFTWAYAGDPIPQEEQETGSLNPDGTANYTVTVTDPAGNGVEGVMVQLCTAESCQVIFTDATGVATLTAEPYAYEVHILKATGYAVPDQTWVMPENGGNLDIELTAQ